MHCTIPIFLPTHQMAPKHFTSSSVLKWCFWNAILGKSLPNEAHTKKSHLSGKSKNILSIWRCEKYGVLEVKEKWICTLEITRKLKTPFHISKYHPELLKCSFTATAKQCRATYRIENRDRSVDEFFAFYKIISTRMLRAGGVEGNYNHP